MVGKQWRQRAKTAGFYGLVILVMLPTAFVFYWMVTLSMKPQIEAAAFPPIFFNFSITFKGYVEVFAKHPFLLYIWNSLVVAAGTTLLGLIVGLPAAYSIAQWKQQKCQLKNCSAMHLMLTQISKLDQPHPHSTQANT